MAPISAETPIHEQIAGIHINSPTNHDNDQHLLPPSSPSSPSTTDTNTLQSYSVENIIRKQGYIPLKRYTKTLQGSIWQVLRNVNNNNSPETQIVKVTNKSLHNKKIAYINGKSYSVSEDIVKETAILRYLSDNQPPLELAIYKNCFCDNYNYFLVQEDAGDGMFHFVQESHELIKKQLIDITEWHRLCKNAMSQMLNVLEWMHNQMNTCHLDISLENFAIKNIKSTIMMHYNQSLGAQKKIEFSSNFKIKIIDFGLAEVFTNKKPDGSIDFSCKKYVGKTSYKAPKVYGKKEIFDARAADCFSLAVCFFMMFTGSGPWKKPTFKDPLFSYIMNGQLIEVLDSWGLLHYVSAEILDILIGLFRSEDRRLTMKQLKEHCWFN
eukprot:199741_1